MRRNFSIIRGDWKNVPNIHSFKNKIKYRRLLKGVTSLVCRLMCKNFEKRIVQITRFHGRISLRKSKGKYMVWYNSIPNAN
jgi:hypothetical protein